MDRVHEELSCFATLLQTVRASLRAAFNPRYQARLDEAQQQDAAAPVPIDEAAEYVDLAGQLLESDGNAFRIHALLVQSQPSLVAVLVDVLAASPDAIAATRAAHPTSSSSGGGVRRDGVAGHPIAPASRESQLLRARFVALRWKCVSVLARVCALAAAAAPETCAAVAQQLVDLDAAGLIQSEFLSSPSASSSERLAAAEVLFLAYDRLRIGDVVPAAEAAAATGDFSMAFDHPAGPGRVDADAHRHRGTASSVVSSSGGSISAAIESCTRLLGQCAEVSAEETTLCYISAIVHTLVTSAPERPPAHPLPSLDLSSPPRAMPSSTDEEERSLARARLQHRHRMQQQLRYTDWRARFLPPVLMSVPFWTVAARVISTGPAYAVLRMLDLLACIVRRDAALRGAGAVTGGVSVGEFSPTRQLPPQAREVDRSGGASAAGGDLSVLLREGDPGMFFVSEKRLPSDVLASMVDALEAVITQRGAHLGVVRAALRLIETCAIVTAVAVEEELVLVANGQSSESHHTTAARGQNGGAAAANKSQEPRVNSVQVAGRFIAMVTREGGLWRQLIMPNPALDPKPDDDPTTPVGSSSGVNRLRTLRVLLQCTIDPSVLQRVALQLGGDTALLSALLAAPLGLPPFHQRTTTHHQGQHVPAVSPQYLDGSLVVALLVAKTPLFRAAIRRAVAMFPGWLQRLEGELARAIDTALDALGPGEISSFGIVDACGNLLNCVAFVDRTAARAWTDVGTLEQTVAGLFEFQRALDPSEPRPPLACATPVAPSIVATHPTRIDDGGAAASSAPEQRNPYLAAFGFDAATLAIPSSSGRGDASTIPAAPLPPFMDAERKALVLTTAVLAYAISLTFQPTAAPTSDAAMEAHIDAAAAAAAARQRSASTAGVVASATPSLAGGAVPGGGARRGSRQSEGVVATPMLGTPRYGSRSASYQPPVPGEAPRPQQQQIRSSQVLAAVDLSAESEALPQEVLVHDNRYVSDMPQRGPFSDQDRGGYHEPYGRQKNALAARAPLGEGAVHPQQQRHRAPARNAIVTDSFETVSSRTHGPTSRSRSDATRVQGPGLAAVPSPYAQHSARSRHERLGEQEQQLERQQRRYQRVIQAGQQQMVQGHNHVSIMEQPPGRAVASGPFVLLSDVAPSDAESDASQARTGSYYDPHHHAYRFAAPASLTTVAPVSRATAKEQHREQHREQQPRPVVYRGAGSIVAQMMPAPQRVGVGSGRGGTAAGGSTTRLQHHGVASDHLKRSVSGDSSGQVVAPVAAPRRATTPTRTSGIRRTGSAGPGGGPSGVMSLNGSSASAGVAAAAGVMRPRRASLIIDPQRDDLARFGIVPHQPHSSGLSTARPGHNNASSAAGMVPHATATTLRAPPRHAAAAPHAYDPTGHIDDGGDGKDGYLYPPSGPLVHPAPSVPFVQRGSAGGYYVPADVPGAFTSHDGSGRPTVGGYPLRAAI